MYLQLPSIPLLFNFYFAWTRVYSVKHLVGRDKVVASSENLEFVSLIVKQGSPWTSDCSVTLWKYLCPTCCKRRRGAIGQWVYGDESLDERKDEMVLWLAKLITTDLKPRLPRRSRWASSQA